MSIYSQINNHHKFKHLSSQNKASLNIDTQSIIRILSSALRISLQNYSSHTSAATLSNITKNQKLNNKSEVIRLNGSQRITIQISSDQQSENNNKIQSKGRFQQALIQNINLSPSTNGPPENIINIANQDHHLKLQVDLNMKKLQIYKDSNKISEVIVPEIDEVQECILPFYGLQLSEKVSKRQYLMKRQVDSWNIKTKGRKGTKLSRWNDC